MTTRIFLVGLLFWGLVPTATAQRHNNSWFKLTAAYTINAKYRAEIDLHHRRQNGYGNHNQFDHELLYGARVWLHYQPSHNLTVSLSPYAHFANYKVIQSKADEAAVPTQETRFSAALSVQQHLGSKWALASRSMAEYRTFQNPLPHIIRLRQRLGLRLEASHRFTLGLYDEVLANVPDAHTHSFFDHNRIGAQVAYKCHKHLQFELGYIHIYRRQRNTDLYWPEENLSMGVAYAW